MDIVDIPDQLNFLDILKNQLSPKDIVSVLLPSRGRPELLARSIQSLLDNADSLDNIEVLVAIDEDDDASFKMVKEADFPRCRCYIVPPMGYNNLNSYVNFLASHSNGKWLFFWNDDAIMQSKAWDKEILKHNKFRVLRVKEQSGHPYSIFPIVPREWFTMFGNVSLHAATDAWVSQIAYMCDIMETINVTCEHDRFDLTGNNNDETYKNRPQMDQDPDDPKDLNSNENVRIKHLYSVRIMNLLSVANDGNDWFLGYLKGENKLWEKQQENDPHNLTRIFDE